ncbi:hypothetical protein ALC56_14115 [Trachymyrmex septentrionalis]|uniref:Transposable element P transposase-like RNase H domain-containing protein n=1 Tax=Trachymyrmex septentrionalis TaxID=34720 RepID=A0A195EUP3_9HYME|nr:hypothetical protein ALC56_14115 [Trachymyrmex septentrionalis]
MKLSKTLYFNRKSLKVKGFVDWVNTLWKNKKKEDHILVLMFQPFKRTYIQCLAYFLSVGNTSASIIHKIIMECIILIEQSGLKVDAVISDGISWNRSMWKIFGVTEECVSIQYIVDTERHLWFISDFPHLIKYLRNYFSQFDRYAGIWMTVHYDLNDADGSIKMCKRINALITAMNSRTPKNSLPGNEMYKVIITQEIEEEREELTQEEEVELGEKEE